MRDSNTLDHIFETQQCMTWHIWETAMHEMTHVRDCDTWGDTYERLECMRGHMWETWMYEMTHMWDRKVWDNTYERHEYMRRHIWETAMYDRTRVRDMNLWDDTYERQNHMRERHMRETHCRYQGGLSHMWMRHVTRMNASWHTYVGVMPRVWIWYVIHECVWGGYGQWARLKYRSLLQIMASFVGLFCRRDL